MLLVGGAEAADRGVQVAPSMFQGERAEGRGQVGRVVQKRHTHVSEPLFFRTGPVIEENQVHGYSYSGITILGVFGF